MASVRHIVLVHGAWHGAWCFSALQTALDSRGVPSIAIDLPGHGASTAALTDLYGDAQCVVDTLAMLRLRGVDNVVLVGHSYGGAVITQAAFIDPRIAHLVYVAAFAPQAGHSVISQLMSMPQQDVRLASAMIATDDGNSIINPDLAPAAFYGSCSPEVITAAIARLSPQPMATMTQEVTGSPHEDIPSTYVLCLRDNAVHPEHQKIIAQMCNTIITLDTDHSPFISMTSATADILESVARS